MASGGVGLSIGRICTLTKFAANGSFEMAFLRFCSCCSWAVLATIRFWLSVANSDSARVTSSGAMVPISSCFLLSLYSLLATVTACCCTLTFSREKTSSQYAVMALVTVVMACWAKAQSAILRLLLAMRIFRVFTERPKPLSNCCWNPTNIEDFTRRLNRLAAEVEEERVLSQKEKKVVPVWKPWEYCVLKVEVCNVSLANAESPVPVPEVRGLLTGTLRSSMLRVVVIRGS